MYSIQSGEIVLHEGAVSKAMHGLVEKGLNALLESKVPLDGCSSEVIFVAALRTALDSKEFKEVPQIPIS